MPNEVLLSREGLERLKKELEELKGKTRMVVAEAIRDAKSHGDLRENAAYHEAKLNSARLESRIADLEKVVQTAKVIERPHDAGDSAHLNSKVELEDMDFGDMFTVTLVGFYEADPAHELISIVSPLGEALIGKYPGDSVEVDAPGGMQRFKIKSIS